MLELIFTSNPEYVDITKCHGLIVEALEYINTREFTECKKVTEQGINIANEIKAKAIKLEDENTANAAFTVKSYFEFLLSLSNLWNNLYSGQYKNSWTSLQDCFGILTVLRKFTENYDRFKLNFFESQLSELEKLYPYKVFNSIEAIVKLEECSICGKPTSDLDCNHIRGNLYWGEMAYSIIKDATLLATALVENPLDKRCVIESVNGKEMNFEAVNYFVKHLPSPLHMFQVEERTLKYKNEIYANVGRNDK